MILGFDALFSLLCHLLNLTDTITQDWTSPNMFSSGTEKVQTYFRWENDPIAAVTLSIIPA